MVIKYPNCSIKTEAVLRYSKEEFVQAYMGRAFLRGPKQAEMLADCYDKAKIILGITEDEDKGEATASPEVLSEREELIEDDHSTDGPELG